MSVSSQMLDLDRVVKRFVSVSEEVLACDRVVLQVDRGEFVCVHGVSGAGKSTLIRLCAGIDTPDEGAVVVDSVVVSGLDEKARAAFRLDGVGIIFQDHLLLEEFTALENVSFLVEMRGESAAAARRMALDSLAACGIDHLAHRFPRQLSGGQRQRVAVARGWCGERGLLLADEPTGALDSANAQTIFATLRHLCDEGATVVVATHDLRCGEVADNVYEMLDGQLSPKP